MQNIILFTDPNKDPDDLVNLIMLNEKMSHQEIVLLGIVTTQGDKKTVFKRAQYASGVCALLGNSRIPVCAGIGKLYSSKTRRNSHNQFVEDADVKTILQHAQPKHISSDSILFLKTIFDQAKPQSLDILVVAEMTDLAKFISLFGSLFVQKTKTVTIMSGLCLEPDHYLLPDDSTNNANDMESAIYVFQFLRKQEIPTRIINRFAARKVPASWAFFNAFEDIKFIGKHAKDIQLLAFKKLYVGLFVGGGLKRQTPEWFFENYTDIEKSDYAWWKQNSTKTIVNSRGKTVEIVNDETVNNLLQHLVRFHLYDPLTLVATLNNTQNLFTTKQIENFTFYMPIANHAGEVLLKNNSK